MMGEVRGLLTSDVSLNLVFFRDLLSKTSCRSIISLVFLINISKASL